MGTKLALVPGVLAVLMAGTSAIPILTIKQAGILAEDSIERLQKAELAETLVAEQANIHVEIGKMLASPQSASGAERHTLRCQEPPGHCDCQLQRAG